MDKYLKYKQKYVKISRGGDGESISFDDVNIENEEPFRALLIEAQDTYAAEGLVSMKHSLDCYQELITQLSVQSPKKTTSRLLKTKLLGKKIDLSKITTIEQLRQVCSDNSILFEEPEKIYNYSSELKQKINDCIPSLNLQDEHSISEKLHEKIIEFLQKKNQA